MQRKLALLGLTLVAVALALRFALTRGTGTAPVAENRPAPPVQSNAPADVAETEAPREARIEATAPAARVASLRVRSSAGIPLAFVEIEHEGLWVRHELVNGACDALAEQLPALLRAPGHVAQPLEAAQGDVVLEPDALLVIEGQSLRVCLARVVPAESWCRNPGEFPEARARAVADGWISPSEYGVAVAYDRLQPIPRDVEILLVRADGGRMELELAHHPGLRARWEMPCGSQAKGSPLDIEVRRPKSERGRIHLVLHARAAGGLADPPPDFPFGTASKLSADLYEELEIGPGEDRARFAFALNGRQHVLAAFDLSTRAFGRITFEHDGSPRVLPLREALEIRGRVVEKESHAPLRQMSMMLQDAGGTGWIIEAHDLELDPRGGFVLRGPSRMLANEGIPLDPPLRWNLCVEQPGYEQDRRTCERQTEALLDLGEIELIRHETAIVLAAGHGLSARELDGQCIVFADAPQFHWGTRPGAELADGRLGIELLPMEGTKTVERMDVLASDERFVEFTRPLGSILFVHVVDDVRTFSLGPDWLYHPVPEDSIELTLRTEALPAGEGRWRVGWSWSGGWIGVGQIAPREPGTETRVSITVPRGAQQLWWSSTGIPPDLHGDPGGFQAISGSSMKVVLR